MIKLLSSLLVIVFCAINHIEGSGSNIIEALRAYYDTGVEHSFRDEWKKYRQAFENEIASNLRENFGETAVNIYEADKHESHLIAKGFQLTDGVVSVFFEEMVLRELPNLLRPKLDMDLPNNFIRFKSKVGRMFVDTNYYVARNSSSIIYARPEDQKDMSPFSLQQVDSLGKLVIVAEDCALSGLSVATLSGDSVTLGHSPLRLYDCKFMVEISTPDSGAPPVIAPYFAGGSKETLEMIMSRPVREELHIKLQGALYSYINTSVLFGSQSTEFRNTQQTLFKSYHDFVTDYIAKLNHGTISQNKAHLSLPFFEVTTETEVEKKRITCHVELRNITLYGMDTAYATRAGGPFNDGSTQTAADEIVFSSMQIHGQISHEDETRSSLYDFAAELTDVSVTIAIIIDEGNTKLQQIHFLGWRSLEYSMVPQKTEYKARHEHESLVYGYILNELPVRVQNHLISILGDGNKQSDESGGGGGGGSGGGGGGGGSGGGEGGGGEQSETMSVDDDERVKPDNEKDNTHKGFLSDHFLDKNFFSDDVLDKDFLDKDFLDKDFLDKDLIDKDVVDKDVIEKDVIDKKNDETDAEENGEGIDTEDKGGDNEQVDDEAVEDGGSKDKNTNEDDGAGVSDDVADTGVADDERNINAVGEAASGVENNAAIDKEDKDGVDNDVELPMKSINKNGGSNEFFSDDFLEKDFFSDDKKKDFFSDAKASNEGGQPQKNAPNRNNDVVDDGNQNADGEYKEENEPNIENDVPEDGNEEADAVSDEEVDVAGDNIPQEINKGDVNKDTGLQDPLDKEFLEKDFIGFKNDQQEKETNAYDDAEEIEDEVDEEDAGGGKKDVPFGDVTQKKIGGDKDKNFFSDDILDKDFLDKDFLDKDFFSDDNKKDDFFDTEDRPSGNKPSDTNVGDNNNEGGNVNNDDDYQGDFPNENIEKLGGDSNESEYPWQAIPLNGTKNVDDSNYNKKLYAFASKETLKRPRNAAKPFFDEKLFSDDNIERRFERNGSRRHLANNKDPADIQGLRNENDVNIDFSKQEKVHTQISSKENITEEVQDSRDTEKVVLPANVHNTRRHQNLHVSDNEIR